MTMTQPPDVVCSLLSQYLDAASPDSDLLSWSLRISSPQLSRYALCELLAAAAELQDDCLHWLKQQFANPVYSLSVEEQIQTLQALYRDWSTLKAPLSWPQMAPFGFSPQQLQLQHPEDYLPLGSQLGNWTLNSRIGVGGFAVVFAASNTEGSRAAALRIPRCDDDEHKTALNCRRLQSEAELLEGLKIDGVPELYECMTAAFGPVAVTNLVAGTRWDSISDSDRTLAQQIEVFIQLAETVDKIHRSGIVHGDIKQQNVLIDAQGKVWLLDFNGARLTSPDQPQSKDNIGTFGFMSPEAMLTADDAPDLRSDLYSLGALLYELTTGRTWIAAHSREEALVAAVLKGGNQGAPFLEDTPPALRRIIEAAVSHEEFRRYETAVDMATNLREWMAAPEAELKIPVINERLAAWRLGRVIARYSSRCHALRTSLEQLPPVDPDQPLPVAVRNQLGLIIGIPLAASEVTATAGLLQQQLPEFTADTGLTNFFYRSARLEGSDLAELQPLVEDANEWMNTVLAILQSCDDGPPVSHWCMVELAIQTFCAPQNPSYRNGWPALAHQQELPAELTSPFAELCRKGPAPQEWEAVIKRIDHDIIHYLRWR